MTVFNKQLPFRRVLPIFVAGLLPFVNSCTSECDCEDDVDDNVQDQSPATAQAIVSTTVNNEGEITEAIVAQPDAPVGGASVAVTVPQGSKLLDAAGEPVTGTVTLTVTSYNTDPAAGKAQLESDLNLTGYQGGHSSWSAISPHYQQATAILLQAGSTKVSSIEGSGVVVSFCNPDVWSAVVQVAQLWQYCGGGDFLHAQSYTPVGATCMSVTLPGDLDCSAGYQASGATAFVMSGQVVTGAG